MRPRLLFAALAALALTGVAGCDLDARLDIGADDVVAYEVTNWVDYYRPPAPPGEPGPPEPAPCDDWRGLDPEAVTEVLRDPGDEKRWGCHATGRIPLARLSALMGLSHTGDRYALVLGRREAAALTNGDGALPGPSHSRVVVTFPDAVLHADASAHVEGRTVTWTGFDGLTPEGVVAVAAEAEPPGPPLAPLAAASAAALGAGLVVGVAALRGARSRRGTS